MIAADLRNSGLFKPQGSANRRFLTNSQSIVLTPRFSPDGKWILFTMSTAGNADIYCIAATGGTPIRLTSGPDIDTGGKYSSDGSRIVFESDRSGSQQLYVMNADGSNQQRISFGGRRYTTPWWSPRGDLIAFARIGGGFRIGVMNPSGGGEKLLTESWGDEGPTWSPNDSVLMFFRGSQGSFVGQGGFVVGGSDRRQYLDGSNPGLGTVTSLMRVDPAMTHPHASRYVDAPNSSWPSGVEPMAKLKTVLIIATMAIAVAGCQKKRPETLPRVPGRSILARARTLDKPSPRHARAFPPERGQ